MKQFKTLLVGIMTCLVSQLLLVTAWASQEGAQASSLADRMKEAAVYAAFGLCTVFIVLIFISLIISCFRFIHDWEESRNKQ